MSYKNHGAEATNLVAKDDIASVDISTAFLNNRKTYSRADTAAFEFEPRRRQNKNGETEIVVTGAKNAFRCSI